MSRLYSPSTKGFYGLFGVTPPADAIPISDEQCEALMAALAAGKTLVVQSGVVTAIDAAPTAIELRRWADAKCAAVSNSGISVTLSGGRVALADTNVAGRTAIMNLRDAVKPVTWYQSTGALSLDELDIGRIGADVFTHVQAALATWTALCAAISAGTITTHAQIETPPAPIPAWPSASA
jgi:hypothetical protein